ncbi:MAG: AI-2E family transporter [Thermomicrobiales bacterium]|nr:AI-2E family transporter [Thermomicrobiales bacterium]
MPIYLALLLAILTVVALLLVIKMTDVLMLIAIGGLFAAAISGPSARLERWHVPRPVAALVIYMLSLAVLIGLGWFVVPPLAGQISNLVDDAPDYVDRYEDVRRRYDELREDYPQLSSFDEQMSGFRDRIVDGVGARLIDLPTRLFSVFIDLLAVFIISMLLLSTRERIRDLILSMVHPNQREQTHRVMKMMWDRVGLYVRAKVIVMAIIGAITYVALLLIGVPFPLVLAIVVAFGEIIPRVGPWLARIPLLAIAALQGWEVFALTFGASIVIENLKGLVISPFIEGDQLNIHPLLVIIAVLIGAALLGPLGAFIAVPAAAAIQVLFEEVVLPWRLGQLEEVTVAAEVSERRVE